MTAVATPTSPAVGAPSCAVRPPTSLVDASTRAPVTLMAAASVKWLAVSLLAGLLSSIKLHGPGMLAGFPALTYGRLVALQDAVFIYGFASQAAMAVALWLICRLGATPLIGRGATVIAALGWNVSVLIGSVGILAGDLSPYEHFQFPQYTIPLLFLSYCIFGVAAILTFSRRNETAIYPSLWFVLAGLVFFPWILATAMMTLWTPLVRGSVAALVALWAGHNLVHLWLGLIGLASIFYFLPKLTGRSLHSYGLAVFTFWLTILLSQSSGMHAQAAFPAWVGGLSEICTILLVIPAAAALLNWRQSVGAACKTMGGNVPYQFIRKGAVFYGLAAVIGALAALRPANRMLEFTLFQSGLAQTTLLGFVGFSLLGAFAYILPRALQTEWPRPALATLHYRLTFLGACLVIFSLLLGGVIQGSQFANVSIDALKAVRSTFPFVGLAIVGYLILFVAQLAFLVNLACLAFASCCCAAKEGGRR